MKSAKFLLCIIAILLSFFFFSCDNDNNPTNGGNQTFTPDGMVLINSKNASFQMGSENGYDDEMPVHTVSFTYNFWMDTTEVTQADYDAVMKDIYTGQGYTTPSWSATYGVGDDYPAYEVFWGDAVLYCNARSKLDGLDTVYTYTEINGVPGNLSELEGVVIDFAKHGYRLPTEAEWEYAGKAGSVSDFFWNKDYDPYPATPIDTSEVNNYAIWFGNSWIYGSDFEEFGTQPVAGRSPNAYGLYDMAGNVYEWCNDWYGEYAADAATDPNGPETGDMRILRGGSWGNQANLLRSANRTFFVPDYSYYFIGFRVVLPVN